jgi:tripartite ATP-independent transporter DctP family solute receptor
MDMNGKKGKIFFFRFVLVCCAVFIFLVCERGQSGDREHTDSQYVFKYAHAQTEKHPRSKSMLFFKEKLEQATRGRITVELYFSGILGKESEILTMVHQGIIQGCRGGLFSRANKKYYLVILPFLFGSIKQFVRLMESDFGKQINKGSLGNGYYIPACGIAGGFRNITSNQKPIRSPDDLKGLRIRTPPLDLTMKTFSVLRAIPEQIPYSETYLALAQGVVDAQENPYSNIVDMKFYEVQTYLSILNWQLHPDPFYVNPDWYNSLPHELKLAFDSVAEETMAYSNEIWLKSEEDYFDFLKKKLTINFLTQGMIEQFKKAVRPVWQYYVDAGFFSWEDLTTAIRILTSVNE